MGWVEMSEREFRRAEVLVPVLAGRLTMTAGAGLMGIAERIILLGMVRLAFVTEPVEDTATFG